MSVIDIGFLCAFLYNRTSQAKNNQILPKFSSRLANPVLSTGYKNFFKNS